MFGKLRSYVYLRRLTLAQERTAEAMEAIARVLTDWWDAEHPVRRGKIEFGEFDVAEANKLYKEQLEAEGVDVSEL